VEWLEVRSVVQNECLSIKSRIEALDGDRQPLVNERCFAAVIGDIADSIIIIINIIIIIISLPRIHVCNVLIISSDKASQHCGGSHDSRTFRSLMDFTTLHSGRFLLYWSTYLLWSLYRSGLEFISLNALQSQPCAAPLASFQPFCRHIHSDHEHVTEFFLITTHGWFTEISLFVYCLMRHIDFLLYSVHKWIMFSVCCIIYFYVLVYILQ